MTTETTTTAKYQFIDAGLQMPIAYNIKTPAAVVAALESARKNRTRIKIYLGDIATGKNWNEENDVTGYIGLSKGYTAYYPILVHNQRSQGGGALLEDCILKIRESKGKKVLYQSELYTPSKFELTEKPGDNYPYSVAIDGIETANFKNIKHAQRYIKKLS